MKSFVCPRCGSNLIEDAWESLQEKEDGGFVMDAYPIYICQQRCGFMKRVEVVPKVIAQQGDDRLLLLYPDEQGRILDLHNSVIWPPIYYHSILGRGYWDEYTGNHDVEVLLDSARDSESAFIEFPNLFKNATIELSQDALFLCWFLSWSKHVLRAVDRPLHEAAVDFIIMIFNLHNIPSPTVETLDITPQFNNLDILAIVNNTYAILIEAKTIKEDHVNNQLVGFCNAVKKEYPKLTLLPIYFKISEQSSGTFHSLEHTGYVHIKSEIMLEILDRGKRNGVKNTIFLDYFHYLQQLGESEVRGKVVKFGTD